MSELAVEPLHDEFGARITGLDLKPPLSVKIVEEIHELVDRYSFLCFPDQSFNDERQLAFTCSLGEPEEDHVALGQRGVISYFGTIGNVQEDGTQLGNDHKKIIFLTGNNMWHSDSSFRKIPSYVSIMCAYEVPAEGSNTQYVSTRAAYRRLPETLKSTIGPLVALHDYVYSRSKVSPEAVTPSHAASLPPVKQRLVRTNRRTGEKNYYVGSHAKVIDGWGESDSRNLLDGLLTRAVGDEHVYTHTWQPGQLVIWDNRCLLHRGTGYDANRYRRYMRQTRVRGTSTLDE